MANAINTFNPQLVVIGGPIGSAGMHVLNSVRRVVERRALSFPLSTARVVSSALGEEACAAAWADREGIHYSTVQGTSR